MKSKFSEVDVTWASLERKMPYAKIEWKVRSNGIPVYTFLDKDNKKIDINGYID